MEKAEMRQPVPPYIFFILMLTILYLGVELCFSAHLLDIAGGISSREELDRTEHWGRIISGVAVALAVCGSIICPLCRRRKVMQKSLPLSLLVGGLLIFGVYEGERRLVDWLVDSADPVARRNAALLAVASHQLKREGVNIRGLRLDADVLAGAEGKAFVSLFSPFLAALPEVDDIIMREAPVMVRHMYLDEVNGPKGFYQGPYKESLERLHQRFLRYATEANKCIDVLRQADAEAEQAWQNYTTSLRRRGWTPAGVPQRFHARIRRQIRDEGVPVADNWRPSDKAGFVRAFLGKVRRQVDTTWKSAMLREGLEHLALPLTLHSFEVFLQHPPIQAEWRREMSMPDHVPLSSRLSYEEYEAQVFTPFLDRLCKEKMRELRSLPGAFAPGGRLEETGRQAIESLVVPPLALAFSLLGAILHLCKFTYYLSRLTLPLRRALLLPAGLFLALLALPLALPGSITGSLVYERVETRITATRPKLAYGIRWIIQAQRLLYPVNKAVLLHVTRRAEQWRMLWEGKLQ